MATEQGGLVLRLWKLKAGRLLGHQCAGTLLDHVSAWTREDFQGRRNLGHKLDSDGDWAA